MATDNKNEKNVDSCRLNAPDPLMPLIKGLKE